MVRHSSLYRVKVMHQRLSPRKHRFVTDLFMFYLDLEEIDYLDKNLFLFGKNRRAVFEFRERDHLSLGAATLGENIRLYFKSQQVQEEPGRIFILTNLRVLGYVFNPVSFYFCLDKGGAPLAAVAEVGNTFGEIKPYLLSRKEMKVNPDGSVIFDLRTPKMFYVSPFSPLDAGFHFRLRVPGKNLEIFVNDFERTSGEEKTFFVSTLSGAQKPLNVGRLAWYLFRFPLVTLRVIASIHFQALLLWLKRVPFIRKHENPDLQQHVQKPGLPAPANTFK